MKRPRRQATCLSNRALRVALLSLLPGATGGGLRGMAYPNIGNSAEMDGLLGVQELPPWHAETNSETPPLTCATPTTEEEASYCSNNQHHNHNNHHHPQTPICHYNQEVHQYESHCVDVNATGVSVVHNPHPKSYCGVCKPCFDHNEQLRAAVDAYLETPERSSPVAQQWGYPMNAWCTSRITDLSHLFFKRSKFNQDISHWDVSRVTDLTSTFQNAYAFNQNIGAWNVGRVQSMERTFAMAVRLDQDLSQWDVSAVEKFGYMFIHCLEFNHDLSQWDVRAALDLNSMFFGATNFHQNLQAWQISEHADTERMCEWSQAQGYP